jgi:hypothetical protein
MKEQMQLERSNIQFDQYLLKSGYNICPNVCQFDGVDWVDEMVVDG